MNVPDFNATDHRPWPLPASQWTWLQQWYDLLFAHWPIPANQLRPQVPPELAIDTFDGSAWIGVVPFQMRIKRRAMPGIPTARHFPELNVRTYVRCGDRCGVWFFSLDATSRLAVWGGRTFFHLPYYRARIIASQQAELVRYRSMRYGSTSANFNAIYRSTSPVEPAMPGSLEHWLTERYCLFSQSRQGHLYCGEIHHAPWPLQRAEAEVRGNTMLAPLGIEPRATAPLLHFAKSIDVALWPLRKVSQG